MADKQESEPKMRNVKPLRGFGLDEPLAKASEPKKSYPKLTIPLDSIPEAKEWGIGETYNLDLQVVMVGVRQDEYSNEATFELRKIGVEDEDEEEDNNDEEDN